MQGVAPWLGAGQSPVLTVRCQHGHSSLCPLGVCSWRCLIIAPACTLVLCAALVVVQSGVVLAALVGRCFVVVGVVQKTCVLA